MANFKLKLLTVIAIKKILAASSYKSHYLTKVEYSYSEYPEYPECKQCSRKDFQQPKQFSRAWSMDRAILTLQLSCLMSISTVEDTSDAPQKILQAVNYNVSFN